MPKDSDSKETPSPGPQEKIAASVSAKPSFNLLIIVLVIALTAALLTVVFLAALIFRSKQEIVVKPSPTQSGPTVVSQELSKTKTDPFQQILAKYCRKMELEYGFSEEIEPAYLPVFVDKSVDAVVCTGDFAPNTGYVVADFGEKPGVNIYDQYSQEAGHGGPPFLGSLDNVIKDDGNIKLSVFLGWPHGGCAEIGQIPLYVRGEKKMELENGEAIFANTQIMAIDEQDPRLAALLQEKTKPCEFDENSSDIMEPDLEGLDERINERFFSDMNNLESPEKEAVADVINILKTVNPKKMVGLDKEAALEIVEVEMGGCDCAKRSLTLTPKGYVWEVTVLDERLMDDSIEAVKTVVLIDNQNGVWNFYKQAELYRCAPGRGQQDFSEELCL